MKSYLKLIQFIRGHVKILVLAVICMMLSAVFDGFQLSLIVPITDKILSKTKIILPDQAPAFLSGIVGQINTLDPLILLKIMVWVVVAIFLLKGFFTFWHGYLMNLVSQCVMRDMRSRLYETIQNLSIDYFSKKRTGELIARITNDVLLVENAVSYGITDLFYQTFRILIFIVIIFSIHLKLALIVFVLFPLVAWPMSKIGKKLRKLSKSEQEKIADINSLLIETISGVRVVKAFGMEDYESHRFKSQNQQFFKVKMKSIMRLLLISPITEFIGVFVGLLVFWWMGKQVVQGAISFGVFALFFAALMSIISPLKKLSNVHAITQRALAASERIYDILETEPTVVEKANAIRVNTLHDEIRMENIFFSYDQESAEVLKNINLDIKCGELVAVVGPTGAGKTTLVNLIPRFYDPTKGRMTIDGIDLREVSFKSLRGQTGIVTQETILFNDTVKANIAYGHLEASQEDVEEAARKAFAHRFIVDMPQGYDTFIGDRGFRLSGGEKQRIAIARAILKNPPLLILDEATSQLDSESERFVQEALDKLMKGRTVICIAHRLSTIKKADKIVVLRSGEIDGLGTHDELLKMCTLYKRLYETQFQM
ncbi:MAG: ABC transporter ATP-binding protein [Candidatus Omnitrophota bacterium]